SRAAPFARRTRDRQRLQHEISPRPASRGNSRRTEPGRERKTAPSLSCGLFPPGGVDALRDRDKPRQRRSRKAGPPSVTAAPPMAPECAPPARQGQKEKPAGPENPPAGTIATGKKSPSGRRLRRLHFLLLDGFYLIHQIVRELHIGVMSLWGGFHVRLLP